MEEVKTSCFCEVSCIVVDMYDYVLNGNIFIVIFTLDTLLRFI